MRIALALLTLASMATLLLTGCPAPCDRMCDAKADYIQACVDFSKEQIKNDRTPPPGWDVFDPALEDPSAVDQWWSDTYQVGDAEEYASQCKDSADDVLSDLEGEDQQLMEQECEDEAIVYEGAIEEEDKPSCYLFP